MIRLLSITMLALALSACSVTRRAPTPALLDLGPGPTVAAIAPATARGPVWMDEADVSPLLDGPAVVWRDGEGGQPQRYAYHRWVAPPAQLLQQRLREVLARSGPVLARASARTPQLHLALDRFEQVFSGGGSHAQLDLRVLLLRNGEVLDQLLIAERVDAAANDAPAGAAALRTATERAVARIDAWLAARPELGDPRR